MRMKIYMLFKDEDISSKIKCVSDNIDIIRKCICKEFNPDEDYPIFEIYENGKLIDKYAGSNVLRAIAKEINNRPITHKKTYEISEEKLEEMFNHYIERRCKAIDSSGYDEMWISGEAEECKRWLELFGVDVSYGRVQPLIEKMNEGK